LERQQRGNVLFLLLQDMFVFPSTVLTKKLWINFHKMGWHWDKEKRLDFGFSGMNFV